MAQDEGTRIAGPSMGIVHELSLDGVHPRKVRDADAIGSPHLPGRLANPGAPHQEAGNQPGGGTSAVGPVGRVA